MRKDKSFLGDIEQYTKPELIYYLKSISMNLPMYCRSPKSVILEKRLKDIDKKISINLDNSEKLSKQYEDKQIDFFNYMLRTKENHQEWQKLNKSHDKILNELYPRD